MAMPPPGEPDTMEAVLDLTPEEARTYSMILDAASTLPKTDPRFALTLTFTWWLLHRRRRLEQQRVRRRQFYRRLRRLIFLRWHLQRNKVSGVAVASSLNEAAAKGDLAVVPEKRLWVRNDRSEDFWTKVDKNLLSPDTFRKYFHMSRETFDYVYDELAEQLQKSNTSMRDSLPGKKRLAATIYRMATNAEYHKVASLFGIGKSTTTSLVREVCDVIVSNLRDKFLTFVGEGATTKEEMQNQIQQTSEKFGISNVVGVLGSIDVLIIGSSWDWSENSPYLSSYHKNYAVTFQAVVDGAGRFSHVNAGSPSSLTNKQIVENCGLRQEVTSKLGAFETDTENATEVDYRIIADESYGGESLKESGSKPHWLLTPLELATEVEDESEKQLVAERISQAQLIFDDAIFNIKSRWKIFHGKNGKINFSADAFEKIAVACCILHNICDLKEDAVDQSWGSEIGPEVYNRRGQPKNSAMQIVDAESSLEDSEMVISMSGAPSIASTDAADADTIEHENEVDELELKPRVA